MTEPVPAPSRREKPSMRERAGERTCPNCGGSVERRSSRGPMPTFCGPTCKTQHAQRHRMEGAAVIGFLKAWRIDRGVGEIAQLSFAEVCATLDLFNTQDREAKRPRADLYAAKMLIDGTKFIDRQRQVTAARTRARVEADAEA